MNTTTTEVPRIVREAEDWVFINCDKLNEVIHLYLPPATDYIILAVFSGCEAQNHVHLAPGELRQIVAGKRKKPASLKEVREGIRLLIKAGVLLPGSWTRCLIVSPEFARDSTREATACPRKPGAKA